MKRAVLLILGIIVLALIPIYAVTAPAATEVSEFDIIATAADDYLNDPDTVLNISSTVPQNRLICIFSIVRGQPAGKSGHKF